MEGLLAPHYADHSFDVYLIFNCNIDPVLINANQILDFDYTVGQGPLVLHSTVSFTVTNETYCWMNDYTLVPRNATWQTFDLYSGLLTIDTNYNCLGGYFPTGLPYQVTLTGYNNGGPVSWPANIIKASNNYMFTMTLYKSCDGAQPGVPAQTFDLTATPLP